MFEVEAILFPQPFIDGHAVIVAIQHGLDIAAIEVQKELATPTSTWTHKPLIEIDAVAFTRDIGTDDPIYGFVNNGTVAHPIPSAPKAVGSLRYAKGGTPKTQPGVITARSGSKGTDIRFAKIVQHPGIQPRLFDETIGTSWENDDKLSNIIQGEIDKIIT